MRKTWILAFITIAGILLFGCPIGPVGDDDYSYSVTFDSQSATTPADPATKTVDSPDTTIDALPTPPMRSGYIFGGWWTAINGAGTQFTASTQVVADITVYAKWNIYNYTVTFDSQSATVPADPTIKNVASPATTIDSLPSEPTKTGDTFGGWWTAINGGGTELTALTPVTANITVYAKWISDYPVGSTGPSGGLIFYDKGIYSYGWRFLEAAPTDQSTGIRWNVSYDGVLVSTGTAIGSGQANTDAIVNAYGAGSYAAQMCNDLIVGSFDDWFLPSKNELDLMYDNLHAAGIGGFVFWYYWSSSEFSVVDACYQRFDDGFQGINPKGTEYRVRAARAF